mmetsp:Transcript_13792/g.22883  ORF Transcript_13792/g.22883 Transcript_13792/m.22883 type:complete len:90 (-) Transcript_13792:227-496(-)
MLSRVWGSEKKGSGRALWGRVWEGFGYRDKMYGGLCLDGASGVAAGEGVRCAVVCGWRCGVGAVRCYCMRGAAKKRAVREGANCAVVCG